MDETAATRLARIDTPGTQLIATVEQAGGDGLVVAGPWGTLAVRVAASCLLQPGRGDRVLVAGVLPDEAWIVAVLERAADAPVRLALAPGVELRSTGVGQAELHAEQSLTLRSDALQLVGRRAKLMLAQVDAVVREASMHVQALRVVGDVVESTWERLTQWLGSSHRRVRSLDQVASGDVEWRAERTMTLHARHVLASADKLARVDGEQVHIG